VAATGGIGEIDARHVGAGFDAAAGVYDELLERNRQGAERLVASLPPGPFPRVLDVGCGTGFASIAMARLRGAREIVGVDLSQEMLARFRKKVGSLQGVTATAVRADVLGMPVPEGGVDAVVSAMAFHWFPDKPAAVRAMAAALRPGGVLGLLAAGRGTEREFRTVLAGIEPPVPPGLVEAFDRVQRDQDEMTALLADAGLEPLDVWTETRRRQMDPDRFLERVRAVSGHLTGGMAADEREELGRRIARALHEASGPGGFSYTFVKLFAVARRPPS
jgi:ubiquinone/menaquinone biosynthesis C-methylase UbiE